MHYLRSFLLLFSLTACTDGFSEFPVSLNAQEELGQGVKIVQLDAANAESFNERAASRALPRLQSSADWNYRVGPGDILSVIVFNHPELSLPAGPDRPAAETGFRVQSDGTFFYPFVGQVQGAGLAPEEIRANLRNGLAEYIADPQLEVRVAAFNSQAVNVTGAVESPRRLPVTTVALTLIDAINATGGLSDDADPQQVTIKRSGVSYGVDFESFLERGDKASNPLLGAGDVVFIPKRAVQEVFVLGEVGSPASIDLAGEPLSLTQALSQRGGLTGLRADASGIFVFRRKGNETTVFQLSVESPEGYLVGARFMLDAGDVVYVTRSPRQRWNDTIYGLLPSIGAVNTTSTTVDGL